ncbi:MAG: beta/gamma crystallin family protein [Betaproteobacteria bacterium]|nr:beta/gamma crystallin family protein [Betaproteobacteria bacterium]MDE2210255.1 beta/gamma crystallin family protein [Betaproteobacteria bacterium]MDE2359322.1 beta/gamma crystallin family protein [Betaproteobacteria bacterium]
MKKLSKPLATSLAIGILSLAAGSVLADSVTFYQEDNYRGNQFTADRAIANFAGSGFNDRVNSAVVHDGRWEICVDAGFNGSCSVLAPGAYPNLGAYAGRISSVRPMDGNVPVDYSGRRHGDRGRNGTAGATLYEGPNLSGRSYSLDGRMPNLEMTGFNDGASSLRVVSGYWIFCSGADFQGECRTFGPGDYASLPGMNNVISSGRRIASAYPYGEKPDWQREQSHASQDYQNRQQ